LVKYVSPQYKEIFGFEPSEIVGKSFVEYLHPEDLAKVTRSFTSTVGPTDTKNFEVRTRNKAGEYLHIWASVKVTPKVDGDVSIVCILRDITEMFLAQSQIEMEKNRAEFYLDLLSHDIGNIHQGMQLWTSIARSKGAIEGERNMALTRLEELEKRSIKLVRNVLLLSRLKDMKPDLVPIDIVPLIKKAMDDTRGIFAQRAIEASISLPGSPTMVKAEPVVEEVFFNVFHNAVKFQYDDPAFIGIEMKEDGDRITVEITDRGMGIPPEKKKHIFDRYVRGSDYDYTGIGLSLVRDLVKRYNGELLVGDRVKGEHSKGARFTIRFPKHIL